MEPPRHRSRPETPSAAAFNWFCAWVFAIFIFGVIGFVAGNVVYGALAQVNEKVAEGKYWQIVIGTMIAGWILGLSATAES